MWFIYWFVSVYIIAYLIYYAFQNKLKEIKNKYEKLSKLYQKETQKENELYKDAYYNLLMEYNKAKSMIDFYKRTSNNIHINDDIKEAIKMAMIYSHPDKGLNENTDQFIKFKKLYDTYK